MKNYYNKLIIGSLCILSILLFIIIFQVTKPHIANVEETTGELKQFKYIENPDTGKTDRIPFTLTIGEDLTAIRINDLTDLKSITKVNYIPDEFVHASSSIPENCQIIDLTQDFSLAKKGTLIFIILNLNPASKDFSLQSKKLEPYKIGDYWHFSLSIPNVFSASNVYQNAQLISRNGSIENYDFTDFNTNYDKKTENFSSHTGHILIDLPFYTRRETLENAAMSAQIITIHYQSENTSFSGIKDFAWIGTEQKVNDLHKNSSNLSISFAILSIVVLGILAVLSILKHTAKFITEIFMIFGILLSFFSEFVLLQSTTYPLLWISINSASIFITLTSTLLSVGKNYSRFPLKYILSGISFLGIILSVISPYLNYPVFSVIQILCLIIKYCSILSLLLYLGIQFFSKKEEENLKLLCAFLIIVILITSLLLPQVKPNYLNASFWLSAICIAITFLSVFKIFMETEKANQYLNSNLHLEVERQTKDIKAVIQERDHLLQFVSHDMKKPLTSSLSLIDVLIERENNIEQTKALNIVKQNTHRVINNLSEIAHYAKYNYLAEPSQVVHLKKLLSSISQFHTPDCNANGILLKNLVDKPYKIFGKPQGLENAISNIIINAIEHANCTTITLSAKTEKNKIILSITDNGKGIHPDIDVFKPYISENKPETGGLGLYICKSIVESMNGELRFQSKEGETIFYITLLQA